MGSGASGSWAKYGCLTVAGLLAIVLFVLAVAIAAAVRQNRDAAFDQQEFVPDIPALLQTTETPAPVRLRLDAHTAGVSVHPVPAGEAIRVEADFDPRRHSLIQRIERVDGAAVMIVELQPLGSKLMALLRIKLGGRLARLRIFLPRDVPLEIDGSLNRCFAVMELGGLSLSATRFDVKEGALKVSFAEPLTTPMENLSIFVDRGSLSVVGLGNANPRKSRFVQHLGAVDLDLRGAWYRDAEVRLIGGAAGGSLWLPDNVTVRGIDEHRGIHTVGDPEVPLPTLDVSISETMGRFVVLD